MLPTTRCFELAISNMRMLWSEFGGGAGRLSPTRVAERLAAQCDEARDGVPRAQRGRQGLFSNREPQAEMGRY